MRLSCRRLTLFLALGLFSITHAQPSQEPLVSSEIRLFTFTNPILDWKYLQGTESMPVMFGNATPSPSYKYAGNGDLIFFNETPNPEAQGLPIRTPQARIAINPSWRRVLLIVDRAPQGSTLPYRILPFPGDLSDYAENTYVFINTSQRELAGKIGESQFTIASGKHSVVEVSKDKTKQQVTIQFAANDQGNWTKAYSNVWSFIPGARYIVFVTDDPMRRGSLKFRTIREIL